MDLADLRRRVLVFHRRALHWAVVAALALATAVLVGGTLQRAGAARDAWGTGTPTVVVSRDLPAGHTIGAADMEVLDLPAAARPADALTEAPLGAAVTRAVFAGEPLVAGRVGLDGAGPVAAVVPEGHRGIALPLAEATPALELGDRVELRAVLLDELGFGRADLLGAGEVIAVSDTALTVAVPAAEVGAVVEGLVAGQVVPVVMPAAGS